MSESDDTDVLLLIPPDIFHVPSSDSDANSDCARTGVISELVGHMQSLESRISVIESKDNSLDVSALNNSLDFQPICSSASYRRQTLPRTRFSVSQGASLQNTPAKVYKSLSLPSTPSRYSRTNSLRNEMRPGCYFPTAAASNSTNANVLTRAKHGALMSCSDSSVVPPASCGTGLSHATAMSTKRETSLSLRPNDRTNTNNLCYADSWQPALSVSNLSNASTGQQHTRPRIVQDMDLSEVDELLQEMEATELKLSKRINSGYQYRDEPIHSILGQTVDSTNQEKDAQLKFGTQRKFDFLSCNKETQLADSLPAFSQKKSNDAFPDVSLPHSDSFHLNETDRMISEFKTWGRSPQQSVSKSNGYTTESINSTTNLDLFNVSSATIENAKSKETMADQNTSEVSISSVHAQSKSSSTNTALMSHNGESTKFSGMTVPASKTRFSLNPCKTPQRNGNAHDDRERSEFGKNTVHVGTNTDLHLRYFIYI